MRIGRPDSYNSFICHKLNNLYNGAFKKLRVGVFSLPRAGQNLFLLSLILPPPPTASPKL